MSRNSQKNSEEILNHDNAKKVVKVEYRFSSISLDGRVWFTNMKLQNDDHAIIMFSISANSYFTKNLVPTLYVFGDSTVDVGNNNNLNTAAKANVFPYGIDFNNCSTLKLLQVQ
ncbi:hypothetical protein MTR_5g044210 [Medicago truncatula]|uniref:Triacylglycerol lipase n=1 Tax=Medicago truncatula TaxID=3880 RepID=G7JWT7_MEDTR|nr:hypothetical protein MTR_5g044210 [Medicago truncatula]